MQPAGIVVVAEQQRAEIGAASLRVAPSHNEELVSTKAFAFPPEATIARHVGRIGPFRNDAFQAHFARLPVELGATADLMIAVLQRRTDAGEQLLQARFALTQRDRDQVLA